MNNTTTPSTAAVTGLDTNTSPADVTVRTGGSMDGQSRGADRAPATAIQRKLVRCVMQVSYRTVKGHEIARDSVIYGFQDRKGGLVETVVIETGEEVIFSTRECGLKGGRS